jgi:hypothetical protein
VQLEGSGVLNMREVQVYDMSNVNRALGKHATQSSTYLWGVTPKHASLAVNGIIENVGFDMSHTNTEDRKYHLLA